MAEVYDDGRVRVLHGDCLDVLPTLPAASVDAVVTDPPYDLTAGKNGGTGEASLNPNSPAGRSRISTGGGFMGKEWDATGVAFDPATWRAVLRVLKPGGHLLAFGGTRTFHRLAVAVEDAGFEIRDEVACLLWTYGTGFPKSLDVGKAIDRAAGAEREVIAEGTAVRRMIPGADQNRTGSWIKDDGREFVPTVTAPATPEAARWEGWGTALKPAWEPVIVARKPIAGTVAANVLTHGTGALNIDGCRVATDDVLTGSGTPPLRYGGANARPFHADAEPRGVHQHDAGRWPANLVLTHHPDCGDRCAPGCHVADLDQQSGQLTSGKVQPWHADNGKDAGTFGAFPGAPGRESYGDTGGASRFYPVFRYTAKAPGTERPRAGGVAHPTVKPVDLMRWLVRLVTPPGGLVLDPFAGSGTTGEACQAEGVRALLIEREAEYLDLIRQRLTKRTDPVEHLTSKGDDLGLLGLLGGEP